MKRKLNTIIVQKIKGLEVTTFLNVGIEIIGILIASISTVCGISLY